MRWQGRSPTTAFAGSGVTACCQPSGHTFYGFKPVRTLNPEACAYAPLRLAIHFRARRAPLSLRARTRPFSGVPEQQTHFPSMNTRRTRAGGPSGTKRVAANLGEELTGGRVRASAGGSTKKIKPAAEHPPKKAPAGTAKANQAPTGKSAARAAPAGTLKTGTRSRTAAAGTAKATTRSKTGQSASPGAQRTAAPARTLEGSPTMRAFPKTQANRLMGNQQPQTASPPARATNVSPVPGAVEEPGAPHADGSVLSSSEITFLSNLATEKERPPMMQILSGYPITTEGWDVPIDTLLGASEAQKRSGALAAKFLEFMRERRSRCKAKLGTAPMDWEVVRDFLVEKGQAGGRTTHNVQCKRPQNSCDDQLCCPREYAHGTMVTYYAKLKASPELREFPGLFEEGGWTAWLKKYGKRQQKNNRHPLPAPALLFEVAEDLAMEAFGWIETTLQANLPEVYCALAQFLALFCFDVHSGRRTIDIAKIQAKNTHVIRRNSPQERWLIGIVDNKCNIPPATLSFQRVESPTCPIAAANLYLRCMKEANLEIGGSTGSPFLFPRIFFPVGHGRYPEIGPHRRVKSGSEPGFKSVGKWEHALTAEANVWLSKVVKRCDAGGDRIRIDYTIHGTRGAAAMVSLASQRELSSINAQQGWTVDSEQAKAHGRLLQLRQISTPAVLDLDQIKSFLQQDLGSFYGFG